LELCMTRDGFELWITANLFRGESIWHTSSYIYIYILCLLSGQHMLRDRAQCLQGQEIGFIARILLFYILYLHCLVTSTTWHLESITMSSLQRL
jgi:NhaP-type Na+/H+ and K+/H+ antiporter